MERNADKRADYLYRIGLLYQAEQLVFVDKSSCDRRTTYRRKAWAIRGQRAVRKAFFIRGQRYVYKNTLSDWKLILHRYSVLPALSLDGILSVDIVEGSFDQISFAGFIDGLLDQMNTFPGRNSVIVMDNCRIHHADFTLKMITDRCVVIFPIQFFISHSDRGMRYVFLPAYSPDFNPIELAFSSIKAHLRRHGTLFRAASMTSEETFDAIHHLHDAVWSVTAEDASAWFHHCNYI